MNWRLMAAFSPFVFCAAGLVAGDAPACGMRWGAAPADPIAGYTHDERMELVARAEEHVERGRYDHASELVAQYFPRQHAGSFGKGAMVDRTLRVLAVIEIRRASRLGEGPHDREQRLRWALRVLYLLASDDPNPVLLTEIAEAAAQLPDLQDVARYMLEDLARRDLIVSPEGYAALAQLRLLNGEAVASREARNRCHAMAWLTKVCDRPLDTAERS